jgi:uncharacterized protein with PIN domain
MSNFPNYWEVVWDVTTPRHLSVVDKAHILVSVTGLLAPRVVVDPSDPSGDALLARRPSTISELAAAEQHFLARYRRCRRLDDLTISERLRKLRADPDVRVLDLTDDEMADATDFASSEYVYHHGLAAGLGRGECATLAIAANRELAAGLDDGAARRLAASIGVPVVTTEDLLRAAVDRCMISKNEAEDIQESLTGRGFRGSPSLY